MMERELSRPTSGSEKKELTVLTPEQEKELAFKLKSLNALAKFIGKDFQMPVKLGPPGSGWCWDFVDNSITIDAQDLLKNDWPESQFLAGHEGSHRRISRVEFIDPKLRKELAFMATLNFIEDPRVNNFLADVYPAFEEKMRQHYTRLMPILTKHQEISNFGLALHEYFRLWLADRLGEEVVVDKKLPKLVQQAVAKTLSAAKDAWWTYPTKVEADQSEQIITAYSKRAYEIVRDIIWPEMKLLLDQDEQDLTKQLQEQGESQEGSAEEKAGGEGGAASADQGESSDKKTGGKEPAEAQGEGGDKDEEAGGNSEENASEKDGGQQKASGQKGAQPQGEHANKSQADKATGESQPAPKKSPSEMSEDEDSGPAESATPASAEEIKKRAQEIIERALKEIDQALAPLERVGERPLVIHHQQDELGSEIETEAQEDGSSQRQQAKRESELQAAREQFERARREWEAGKDGYSRVMEAVLPLIEQLENDLRDLFVKRRAGKWHSGFQSGKRLDISRRIQEKAKGVEVIESKAWQRKEAPDKSDYAVELLVDLSGSMRRDDKIEEAFKATVVLTEVLNRLSIKCSVKGFHDQVITYQDFGQPIGEAVREKLWQMPTEVESPNARHNDDGWAVGVAAEQLAKQDEKYKILIVISDGYPEPSAAHTGQNFDLKKVINKINEQGKIRLIGLGLGQDTEHVNKYYPESVANINVGQMAQVLKDLIYQTLSE